MQWLLSFNPQVCVRRFLIWDAGGRVFFFNFLVHNKCSLSADRWVATFEP